MFESYLGTILVAIVGIILLVLPFINQFYQKRADNFANELLAHNPIEYNKQIKGNALRYLISRSIWGLLFGWVAFYNFWNQTSAHVGFKILYLLIAVGFLVLGIYDYKSELKKIKEFE